MTKIRKPFSRVRVKTPLGDKPSMTKQADAQETDINFIIKQYRNTGVVRHTSARLAQYSNTEAISFQDAMDYIARTTQEFEQLPADLRKRFGNDPTQLVEFMNDPANYDEAVKLGILEVKEHRPNPEYKGNIPPVAHTDKDKIGLADIPPETPPEAA